MADDGQLSSGHVDQRRNILQPRVMQKRDELEGTATPVSTLGCRFLRPTGANQLGSKPYQVKLTTIDTHSAGAGEDGSWVDYDNEQRDQRKNGKRECDGERRHAGIKCALD
jgi:hypothetical protein